ncbi:MAG: LLM class flavin-dependent oxidoreductase [Reyranellaceae bacterium]
MPDTTHGMTGAAPGAGGGPSPLQRVQQRNFILGLFLPIQDGGWTPSTAARETQWSFGYNARLVQQAEALGFDLAFALAQWIGKGGYGGRMHYREQSLDPLTVSAGLASLTERMLLISTVHILYGWHPLHIAKFGATLDDMTGGRWGINIVTGYKKSEYAMFGMEMSAHDDRYQMAEDFVDLMERLWREDQNLSLQGRFWSCKDAYVAPKPRYGRPVIVSAGTSAAGIDFAARRSDLMFVTSPGGADIEQAVATLGPHIANIKAQAARHGRDVKCIVNPHVICRDTEREARRYLQHMLEGEDDEAVDNFMASILGGDTRGWRAHDRAGWAAGGNVQIVGSPDQVVDWMVKLKAVGCDGVQINFFDFEPDLKFFGERVLPLMRQAGLREA